VAFNFEALKVAMDMLAPDVSSTVVEMVLEEE
jgi:hypothetical protein